MNSNPIASSTRAPPRAWLGLAVIALPCMLYAMDLTVLNLALPTLADALRPSATELLWIVDIYGFMVAGLLITMGAIGDRIGRRRLLMFGAAAFGAASVLAAFSSSARMLIVARALLGVAGATLAPSTLSLIRQLFENPRERSIAIGVWISSFSLGSSIGPIAGALLLESFGWGSVFLLAVPVMALLLLTGPFLLPEYRPAKTAALDPTGVAMSIFAVIAMIHGIKRIAIGAEIALPLLSIAVGIATGIAFIQRQHRRPDPMIAPSLFRAPGFRAALLAYGLACFATFGVFLQFTQYMQMVLGLSPLTAALVCSPIALAFITGSLIVPMLMRHGSAAGVVGSGFALAGAGFIALAIVASGHSVFWPVAAAVIFSLGLSPVFTLATDLVVGSAPAEQAGTASAISETVAEFGGAIGIALLGSLSAALYRVLLAGRWQDIAPAAPADAIETVVASLAWARAQAPGEAGALIAASRAAFADSLRVCALVAAGLTLAAALIARRTLPRGLEPG